MKRSPGEDCSSSSLSNPFMSLALSIREYFLVTLTTHPFVSNSVSKINTLLLYVNVPEKSLLTNEEFVLSSTAVVVTLIIYYVLFGKRHRRKRKVLAEELRAAQRQVSSICHPNSNTMMAPQYICIHVVAFHHLYLLNIMMM